MTHTELLSRFTPPRAGTNVVPRDALLARLPGPQRCRLALLNAGAGYGKTTLLVQWRQALVKYKQSVVWLSAGPEDDTPRQFCASLAGALQQAKLPVAPALRQLLGDPGVDMESMLVPVLANAVAACDATVHLLIDNFHHAASPPVVAVFQALIDEAPGNLHITLATRVMPDLRLGRLRALDELVELDASALAFGPAETLVFLKGMLGKTATPAMVRAAHACTEGWPAGLLFLAAGARVTPDVPPHRLLRGSRELATYLAEDVIDGLPASLQTLLEILSILPRFDADVAAAVTSDGDARVGVEQALVANVLLRDERTEAGRCWLRMHPLIADFLRKRLLASERDIAPLRRAAAAYFAQAGHLVDAVRQAVLGDDLDAVAALFRRSLPGHGDLTALRHLRHWLRDLPCESLSRHPDVLVRAAWSCVLMQLPRQAARCVDALGGQPLPAPWSADVPLLRSMIAMQGDDATGCMAALPAATQAGWSEIQRQAHAALRITCLARLGRFDEAYASYNATQTQKSLAAQRGLSYAVTMAAARAQWLEGRTEEAQRMTTAMLSAIPRRLRAGSPAACHAAVLLAEILCEHALDDAARAMLDEGEPLLPMTVPANRIAAALVRARLPAPGEHTDAALERLACAETAFLQQGLARGAATMQAEQVRLLAIGGALCHAEAKVLALDAQAAEPAQPGAEADEIALLAALSGARFALAAHRPDDARARCDIASRLASQYGRKPLALKAELLRAVALAATGRGAAALELAQQVIADGRQMRLLRSLCDEGPAWAELLAALSCPEDPALESYRSRLAAQPPVRRKADTWPPPAPVVSAAEGPAVRTFGQPRRIAEAPALTPRERQIMNLVEQGLSNKRVAQMLGLSLDTIKWNMKNIFGKLRVSNRYEAILAMRVGLKA
ncbi:LuxR C-terminal-related transcriptional regulator [Cupriavidus necator]|uniref:LuxR C-terminal-related transcriptional regulator n=1 Tax=Cupriavidus necator TaxID=106590 RepID=UPI003ED165DC